MRVFLAVPGDPVWIASAREFIERWRPKLPAASWTKPESGHLTLRFLGEIEEAAAVRFADAIEAGPAMPEVALPPGGPVVFPPHGRPRVVGVGFAPGDGVEALGDLAKAAESAARAIGAAPEDRPYRPHVTLARLREEPWGRGAVAAFREAAVAWPFPEWRVRSIVLYTSRLHPSGAIHTPLKEWPASTPVHGRTA
jgi:RNA 2',3'-cyclic 3'-phosphodiesterase